ncbi:hypothetical protein ACLKA6_018881 [Drosophila palustris]
MPREGIKKQLTKRKLDLALWELELLDDNDHAAYDEVMDELMEDILTISSCCRGIEFSVPKSFDWRTHVLPNLNEDRFLQMLRVTKMQFQTIVEFVRNDSGFKSSLFRPQITSNLEATTIATEWIVTNCRPFKLIDDSGLREFSKFLINVVDVDNILPHLTTISKNVASLHQKHFQPVKEDI